MQSPASSCSTEYSDGESKPYVALTRRKRKPLMEKRRRARINASLEQLKKLVLEAMKKDSARYSKLEKADILELTVRHLREVQRSQMTFAMSQDTSVSSKYTTGFSECAGEVSRYLSTIDGLSPEVRHRLMQHLEGCAQNVSMAQQAAQFASQQQQRVHPHQHQMHLPPQHVATAPVVPVTLAPLQIQIPSATSASTLPGSGAVTQRLVNNNHSHVGNYYSTGTRGSPEPGCMPPVVEPVAKFSSHPTYTNLNNNGNDVMRQQQQPRDVRLSSVDINNNPSGTTAMLQMCPSHRDVANNNNTYSVRTSPYSRPEIVKKSPSPVQSYFQQKVEQVKEDSMWRPW